MGTRIFFAQGMRYRNYAYRDDSIPDLEGWHSEAYVCGEVPPRYAVPAPMTYSLWDSWLREAGHEGT